MKPELQERLNTMSPAHVVEAAEMVLPQLLEIDDPQDAAQSIAMLAGLRTEDIAEIARLAQEAGDKSRHEITAVLKLVLLDLAKSQRDDQETIERKLESVGRKQIVVGPDLLYLCALLIAGYVAYVRKGKVKEKQTITIEEFQDGRRKITIGTEAAFLNPLNPLSGLIDLIIKRP